MARVRRAPSAALAGRALLALVVLPVLGLPACALPVAVEPPVPDEATVQACRSFVAALPDALSTVGERREVRPDSGLTAAYGDLGDPPVAVRCGVPVPPALTPTSHLVTVEGIDWFPEQLTAGWLMTTVGRTAGVEITVPDAHSPAPSVAADLATTIAAALPPA